MPLLALRTRLDCHFLNVGAPFHHRFSRTRAPAGSPGPQLTAGPHRGAAGAGVFTRHGGLLLRLGGAAFFTPERKPAPGPQSPSCSHPAEPARCTCPSHLALPAEEPGLPPQRAYTGLALLRDWEESGEKRGRMGASPARLTPAAPSRGVHVTPSVCGWVEPTGSVHRAPWAAGRGLERRVCGGRESQLWGLSLHSSHCPL